MQRMIYVPPWAEGMSPHFGVAMELCRPFVIGSPRGTGACTANLVSSSSPALIGAPVHNVVLGPRDISFDIHIAGDNRSQMYEHVRELCGWLTPFHGAGWQQPGVLYYENDAGLYWLYAIPTGGPELFERVHHYRRAAVYFHCPDPLWKSVETCRATLTSYQSLLEFPLSLPSQTGYIDYFAKLTNRGTMSAPVEITVTATKLDNPTIHNRTTGEFIRLGKELPAGDSLYVNTSFWEREVSIIHSDGSRENAYHFIDLDSSFFQLVPGENLIAYAGDQLNIIARITVDWHEQYAGV